MECVLAFALMWKDEKYLIQVENHLKRFYGDFILGSEVFEPPFSKYYYEEMGKPLFKKFIATDFLTTHTCLAGIKKHTIFIEDKYRIKGKRTVNIDPILVDIEKVIVATTKYRGNRVKIDENLYMEIELWFHNKKFTPFPWTYIDYSQNSTFFENVRKKLKKMKNRG